jgi:FkbM family methyltransferase
LNLSGAATVASLRPPVVEDRPVRSLRYPVEFFRIRQSTSVVCTAAAEHGREYVFHVSDNSGASSSILEFAKHRNMFPEVHFTSEIRMTSTTLAHLIDERNFDVSRYGALVIDTQGSELLVLQGALSVLSQMRYVKTEVADFEAY